MVISYNNTRGIGTSYRCQIDIRAIFTVDSEEYVFSGCMATSRRTSFPAYRLGPALPMESVQYSEVTVPVSIQKK